MPVHRSPEAERRHEPPSAPNSGSGLDGRRVRQQRPHGGAQVPRLQPRSLAYQQARAANEAEAARNEPDAVNAEFWRIYHAGDNAYDVAGLDRDSEPTDEAIADALVRLRELEPKLQESGGFNDEAADQIRRNINSAEANLGDEDARDAYDSALNDAADAAAAAQQPLEKFQVEIALKVGCEIDVATGLLRPDLAKFAAQAGTITTLWSTEGGVGKTFAVNRSPSAQCPHSAQCQLTMPNAHTMPNAQCPIYVPPCMCIAQCAPITMGPHTIYPMPDAHSPHTMITRNVCHARPWPMPVCTRRRPSRRPSSATLPRWVASMDRMARW